MSIGPIPRSEIVRYGIEECDLADDALETFVAVLRGVDDEYLRLINSKTPEEDGLTTRVPASDAAGVRSLIRELGKPKESKKPPQP